MVWLAIIGGFLGFGVLVDYLYKKRGITHLDPEENAKHVSESERVYIESHMHNNRNDPTNGHM